LAESESDMAQIEYDLDDDDEEWLNSTGASLNISEDEFEYMIDQYEKQVGFRPVRPCL
jgi:hypothetical protein